MKAIIRINLFNKCVMRGGFYNKIYYKKMNINANDAFYLSLVK